MIWDKRRVICIKKSKNIKYPGLNLTNLTTKDNTNNRLYWRM